MEDTCVICGKYVSEGSHVCPLCARKADAHGAPTGYITTGDVAQMGGLRGQQIAERKEEGIFSYNPRLAKAARERLNRQKRRH